MKKLLIAAAAVVGFAGVASAQQAPFLYGNYTPDVLEAYNNSDQTRATGGEFSSRASAVDGAYTTDHGIVSAQTTNDLRSGK
jgi:hypothetical protein